MKAIKYKLFLFPSGRLRNIIPSLNIEFFFFFFFFKQEVNSFLHFYAYFIDVKCLLFWHPNPQHQRNFSGGFKLIGFVSKSIYHLLYQSLLKESIHKWFKNLNTQSSLCIPPSLQPWFGFLAYQPLLVF